MDLNAIQTALRERKLDGWLFYDHHHRDPIAYRLLGLSEKLHVTRRWFYLIPAQGEPQKLAHRVEPKHLDNLPGNKRVYSSWQEQHQGLKDMLAGVKKIAMQYSENNQVPLIGLVDAGTVELIRSFGKEIVTSGDLVAQFEATLSAEQIASHFAARDAVDPIMASAFKFIREKVNNGGTNEYEVQKFILEGFKRANLITDDPPIVGVNVNSGNPHYSPSREGAKPIREGDFVLIDMWAKLDKPGSVFYDITWTGVVGKPSDKQREIFGIVRGGRDAGIKIVQDAFAAKRRIGGWEVDKATRDYITSKGYGEYFAHRTGHSIGVEIHSTGANMDNLETKDDREIIPNTCFSIEPGIYLPEFGVRSEIDMIIRDGKAEVSGKMQTELVLI
jgi:Xaa-Pro dipeptidase